MYYIERPWTNIDDAEACMYISESRLLVFKTQEIILDQKALNTRLKCLNDFILSSKE